MVKNPSANAENERHSGSVLGLGKFPGEGNGNFSILAGQRNLAGYSPRGCKELDMTE